MSRGGWRALACGVCLRHVWIRMTPILRQPRYCGMGKHFGLWTAAACVTLDFAPGRPATTKVLRSHVSTHCATQHRKQQQATFKHRPTSSRIIWYHLRYTALGDVAPAKLSSFDEAPDPNFRSSNLPACLIALIFDPPSRQSLPSTRYFSKNTEARNRSSERQH